MKRFYLAAVQPPPNNNDQQTRSVFGSGLADGANTSRSPTPTNSQAIQQQTASQSLPPPTTRSATGTDGLREAFNDRMHVAGQNLSASAQRPQSQQRASHRQPSVTDESDDASDATATIETPGSPTHDEVEEFSEHDEEHDEDHWSGLLQRINDFRTRQQNSGIDAVARRREEHVMTLMGVALDLAESGIS